MKNISILILLIFLIISCFSQGKQFANTKWIYDYGHCQDYFEFKIDSGYVFYSCETGDTILGKYSIYGSIIQINQEYSSFDNEFAKDSRHRVGKAQIKLILINNNQLGYIENWDENKARWKENYYFKEK